MAIELMLDKWQGKISEVSIGATRAEGGSRGHVVKIGGEGALPFLADQAGLPNKPQIAFEIWDSAPSDWPDELAKQYSDVYSDPLAWAEKCVKAYKAKILCVKLQAAHPDFGNKTPEQEAEFISGLLKKVDVPLVILGCGDDDKDNLVLPACSEAAKNERCLIGSAVQDNYKTLTAAALADGHNIIAESPIDINIAKQLNILISDIGLSLDRIVINPTIGALGYGLEYAYSIMERARLSGLSADKMMALPFICLVGQEAWRAKEARVSTQEFPAFGPEKERGVIWESLTATALIQAGADLLVMRHPEAVKKVNEYIERL
ncbi:MAG: acetyl-CoA decarbonylase/synthase complex subunit delta [Candidatus Omnitrophica bacterium]|jgi:acetyl-CoA decarbonylase/synthase complex subunit delta|nr:acetyl-CoA decarbonylase/synthase complex subunit delta [Candidatus Omnitrophota bacterium]MDD5079841.1 acetyl-CoA decarbonylase/synthase complex subunit delta [Candidatus Omnitrophota bacterium]